MEKLPGDYIAGFVDGEGCFALKFRRDVRHDRKNKPVYFYWDIEFAILLRADDKDILEKIKNTLNCGKISISKRGAVRYSVNNVDELVDKIVPFFDKYSLHAKKKYDFNLWQEALVILERNRQLKIQRPSNQVGFSKVQWSTKDLNRLKQIRLEMKPYKSGNKPWKWLK